MVRLNGDYVDDDEALLSLIESLEKTHPGLADAVRAVRRARRIKTSELVGGDNMIGARVTFVDNDGDPHRGVVIEPEVSSMPGGEAYDPNRDEFVDPSDYPMGTVQLVRGDGWEFGIDGFFDRIKSEKDGRGLRAETSVTPAREPDSAYCYFAGWDYFDEHADVDG